MSNTVISIEDLSKSYHLGTINTGTFYGDLNRWWAKQRGRPDPYLKIGEKDHGNRQGETLWAQLLGSRSINNYESFKTLLDQELDHHVGQQAELKLAMDALHKEDQQLKDLRASRHSEQLAEALPDFV